MLVTCKDNCGKQEISNRYGEKNPLYICRANLDKNIHVLDYLLSDGQSLEYNTNKALRTMHAQY